MSFSTGSGITLRADRLLFDVDTAADIDGDATRTGSGSTHADEHWRGQQSGVDRRRSFAAMSSSRLSSSPPTIEDVDGDLDDDDDQDDDETKNVKTKLLMKDVHDTLFGDDLHLEEPLPLLPSTDNCLSPEELDRVTTLQWEDYRRRRRLGSRFAVPPLYRCYSTTVDPCLVRSDTQLLFIRYC